jgi:hypothetical protein
VLLALASACCGMTLSGDVAIVRHRLIVQAQEFGLATGSLPEIQRTAVPGLCSSMSGPPVARSRQPGRDSVSNRLGLHATGVHTPEKLVLGSICLFASLNAIPEGHAMAFEVRSIRWSFFMLIRYP